ncbi:MAG TPA: translocation/assembly module TamB domain-containing protein [Vicinamibacterales bacterium]
MPDWRRFGRRAAVGVAVLLAIAMVLIAAVHLPPVRRAVLDRVVAEVRTRYGIELSADRLDYNLITRRVTLHGVQAAAIGRPPFLRADAIDARLSWGTLAGSPFVERLDARRLAFALRRDASGDLNLPTLPASDEPATGELPIGIVSLDAASAGFIDDISGRRVELGPLSVTVHLSDAPGSAGSFDRVPFAIDLGGAQQLTGTIQGRTAITRDAVQLSAMRVETNAGRAAFDATLDLTGSTPAVRANGTTSLSLPAIAGIAMREPERELAGTMAAEFEVSGPVDAPSGQIGVKATGLAYAGFTGGSVDATITLSPKEVVAKPVSIRFPEGRASGLARVGLVPEREGEPLPARAELRWSGVDLAAVLDRLDLPVRITGSTTGQASAAVRLPGGEDERPLRLERAEALLDVMPGDGEPGVGGSIRLTHDGTSWTAPHRLTLRDGSSVEGTLAGRGSTPETITLGGSTVVRIPDVAHFTALLRDAGLELPEDAEQLSAGQLTARIEPQGTLTQPAALVQATSEDLVISGRGPIAVTARATVDRTRAIVHDATARVNGMHAQASGTYGFDGVFDARYQATVEDMTAAMALAGAGSIPLTGTLRLEGTAGGSLANPRADATLGSEGIVYDGIIVGRVDATINVDGTTASVDASAPVVPATVTGNVELAAPYRFTADATVDNARIASLIPDGLRRSTPPIDGIAGVHVRASGRLEELAIESAVADLQRLDITIDTIPVALARPATVTWTGDGIAVGDLEIRAGEATSLRATGALGQRPDTGVPLRLQLAGDLPTLVRLGAAGAGSDVVNALDTAGRVDLDLTIGGTIDQPEPAGRVHVTAPRVAWKDLPAASEVLLEAVIDPAGVEVLTLRAGWQQAQVSATGRLPWSSATPASASDVLPQWLAAWLRTRAPGQATVTATVAPITPAVLVPFLPADQLADIEGTLALELSATADTLVRSDAAGASVCVECVSASATLTEARLALGGIPFAQTTPTRVRLEHGYLWIDDFAWESRGNPILVAGGTSLSAERPSLDLGVSGTIDLRMIGAFVSGVSAAGLARADITVTGPLDAPQVGGRISVREAELRLAEPGVVASDLDGEFRLTGTRGGSLSLDGLLNGGTLAVDGDLRLTEDGALAGLVHAVARGVGLDYPDGLVTESDADLTLVLAPAAPRLEGRITVLGGRYREPLILTSRLLSLSGGRGIATRAPQAGFLSRLRLDVGVTTATDIHVDNNYGRFDVGGNLRLSGTPERPGLVGTIEVEPDGELYVGGNTYTIEQLTIDFNNPSAIAPELTFVAQTRVGDVPIGIDLQCPASGPCERNIQSLASGVTDAEAESRLLGQVANAEDAGEQLARLLSGEILGLVGRRIGLDTLRLEQQAAGGDLFGDPTLVAGDVNPASRLTIAKRIGQRFELVLSQNLVSSDLTWVTSYFARYGITLRVLQRDDNSRSYEFRHEPSFGRPARARAPERSRTRVADVRITGEPGMDEARLRRALSLEPGDDFEFAAWQRDRDRLLGIYRREGFREARVRAGRRPGPSQDGIETTVLEYAITRGHATRLEVRGMPLPDRVRNRILDRWSGIAFADLVENEARQIVRAHALREGHPMAQVDTVVSTSDDTRTLTITIDPGPRLERRIEFTGNTFFTDEQLLTALGNDGREAAWLEPSSVTGTIADVYRVNGYLSAAAEVAGPRVAGGAAILTIRIEEGPAFTIGALDITGRPQVAGGPSDGQVRDALGLNRDGQYRPASVAAGVARLEALYRSAGYLDARVEVQSAVRTEDAQVDLRFDVQPGPQSVLADIRFTGVQPQPSLASRAVTLAPGLPIDPAQVAETRRRLSDTGIFRRVDVDLAPADGGNAEGTEQPVVASITLERRIPWRIRYGLALNDDVVGVDEREQRLGVAADVERRGLFGSPTTVGLAARLRRDQQAGRLFLSADRFGTLPVASNVFFSRSRERRNPEGAFPVVADVAEVTAEQVWPLPAGAELRYGYGLGRNQTRIENQDFNLLVQVARLTGAALIDRRNDPFNPATGWFASTSLELSQPALGSDLRFLRTFTQASYYRPVVRGVVLATAVRLGLARTFANEELIPSERFFAGGATSVRGYREDDLGPRSLLGDADGGRAMLILNGELRFPIFRWIRGAAFVDAGNVYPTAGDLSLGSLQVGLGGGLRLDTPAGLLRFDLAVPANRRDFDPRVKWYFGLGQAF